MIRPGSPEYIKHNKQLRDLEKKLGTDNRKKGLEKDQIEAIELAYNGDDSGWEKINNLTKKVKESLEEEGIF